MNKILIFYIIMYCSNFFLYGQNNQELFLKANDLYEQNVYAESLSHYEKITNKSAIVWFNMGNCAFNEENFVDALVYWRRAQTQANSILQRMIEKNIEQAKKKLSLACYSPSLLYTMFESLSVYYTLLVWQLLFLLSWLMLCFVATRVTTKKWLFIAMVIACITLVLAGIVFTKYRLQTRQSGVIKETTHLYVGPNDRFAVHGVMNKGQEVDISALVDGWVKVKDVNSVGWVPETTIIKI